MATTFLQLTHGAEYRLKNVWSGKYAQAYSQTAGAQVVQYTLNAAEARQVWVAELADQYTNSEGVVVRSYNLKNKNSSLYWTNALSTQFGEACTLETLITSNQASRQWYRFQVVTGNVHFMRPSTPVSGYIQLAGPLIDEGRYLQLFPSQTGSTAEQWIVEPVTGLGTQLEQPEIQEPVYSDHTSVFVGNLEAGAGIQLYINSVAYGSQRINTGSVTGTVEVQVSPIEKGKSISADAFKTGRLGNTADAVVVQEFACVVQKNATNGTVTYNLEVLKVLSGTNRSNAVVERFDPPRIIQADIAAISSARSARDTAGYKRTEL